MIERLIETDEIDNIQVEKRDDFEYSLYALRGNQSFLIANISLDKMPYVDKTSVIFEFKEKDGE